MKIARAGFIGLLLCCVGATPLFSVMDFLSAFIEKPKQIGSIVPSSRFLAQEMIKAAAINQRSPLHILEVGAGTGACTYELSKVLQEKDQVDVIELDEKLAQGLRERFKDVPQIRIHCCSILDFKPTSKYDCIISGLPFNSFEPSFVQSILDYYVKHLKRGGVLSYFTYPILPSVWAFFAGTDAKNTLEKVLATTAKFRAQYEVVAEHVFLNIPPATVYHITIR